MKTAIYRPAQVLLAILLLPLTCWAANYEVSNIGSNATLGQGVTNRGVVISTELNQTSAPGDKVVLTISLANFGTNSVLLPTTGGLGDYDIRVSDENGKAPPFTRYGETLVRAQASAGTRQHELPPGKVITVRLVLNRLFDLSMSGKYRIKVSRQVFSLSGKDRVLQNCEANELQLDQGR